MRSWLLAGIALGSVVEGADAQDLSTLFHGPDGTARRVSSSKHDSDEDFVKIAPGAEVVLQESNSLNGPWTTSGLAINSTPDEQAGITQSTVEIPKETQGTKFYRVAVILSSSALQ